MYFDSFRQTKDYLISSSNIFATPLLNVSRQIRHNTAKRYCDFVDEDVKYLTDSQRSLTLEDRSRHTQPLRLVLGGRYT